MIAIDARLLLRFAHASLVVGGVVVVAGAGCPLFPSAADIDDGVNGEVIVSGVRAGDRVELTLDDDEERDARPVDDTEPVVFRLRLAPGDHAGSLRVSRDGGGSGGGGGGDDDDDGGGDDGDRCASFVLSIVGANGSDSFAVDVDDMPGCDGGAEGEGEGEGEGEEGEGEGEDGGEGEGEGDGGPGCVIGDPCDDALDCTDDDRCLADGVCVGRLDELAACGCPVLCDATSACCAPESNDCDDESGLCVMTCADGGDDECTCTSSACTLEVGGVDGRATCVNGATCRVAGAPSSSSDVSCAQGATCLVELADPSLGQVTCEDARCNVDVDGGALVDVECRSTDACFVSVEGTEDTSLFCEDASCSLECGGTGCAVGCGEQASCALDCESGSACSLSCGEGAESCELRCAGVDEPCAAGAVCACP